MNQQIHSRFWKASFALLLAAWAGSAAALDAFSIKLESETLAHSEPVPVRAFVRGWHAPLESGSNASALVRESVTLGYGQWRVGRIYQDIYDVQANRDAARLYHRVANHLPFAPGETFDVALEVRFARSLGWRIARSFNADAFGEFELGVTRWHGLKLTSGTLLATAAANDEDDYQYAGTLDYYYSKDALFDRPEQGADGIGYGFDLAWCGQWQNWRWQAEGKNLLASIHWKQALHTSGQFSSATEQVDSQGRSIFMPTLTGREDARDFRQYLPMDGRLRVQRLLGAYEAGVSAQYLPSATSLVLEAGRHWTGVSARIGLMVAPVIGAGAELEGYGFSLRYFADSFALPKGHWAEARLSWAYPF